MKIGAQTPRPSGNPCRALLCDGRSTAAEQQGDRLPAELDFVNDPEIGDLSLQDTGLRLDRCGRRQDQRRRR